MKLRKNKKFIAILGIISLFLCGLYAFYIRDWSKRSTIDEHWLKCAIEVINECEDMSDIAERLMKDDNFFKITTDAEGISTSNDFFNFKINPNVGGYGYGPYCLKTEKDLDNWLDEEYGTFRPIFNLMCRKYKFEDGKIWISPNLKAKNIYGFTENSDDIMVVLFCKNFTVVLYQNNWGGDKPFERFFLMFYECLQKEDIA